MAMDGREPEEPEASLWAAEQFEMDALTEVFTDLHKLRGEDDLLSTLQPGDAIAMLDLDHLGDVNERLGQASGDEAVSAFDLFLGDVLRDGDAAEHYGGGAFLVVLRARHLRRAASIVERLMRRWQPPTSIATFSAGTAVCRRGELPTWTLARAERALDVSKRSGGDRQMTEDDIIGERVDAAPRRVRRVSASSVPLRV
jgi:diguanylate cyclase (GGDEF)-like protein